MQTEDNTSETDAPTGQGFRYPPHVFMDPIYTTSIPQMEEEGEAEQESKFLGKYCEFCDRYGESHCWCNSSDWEEGMLDIERSGLTLPYRRPHHQQSAYRCRIVKAAEKARPP